MNKENFAFISYRHKDNREQGRQWATWLRQAIETYEVPDDLVGKTNDRGEKIPAIIYPIFRDIEELAADKDLDSSITDALDSSQSLIVLCSPRAVESTHVADEIEYFIGIGRSDYIIAAIIEGEPNVSWDKGKLDNNFSVKDECFPEPLQFEYDENGIRTENQAELIAADFRINNNGFPEQGWTNPEAYRQDLKKTSQLQGKDITEKVNAYQQQHKLMLLKIIANILGVSLRQLTQRDKEYQLKLERQKAKKLRFWLSALAILAILAVGAGTLAYYQKQEAESAKEDVQKQLIATKHNFGLALYERAQQMAKEKYFQKASMYSALALENLRSESSETAHAAGLWYQVLNHTYRPIWVSPQRAPVAYNLNSVSFSSDGKTLASTGFKTIHLWDVETGNKITELQGHNGDVRSVSFSPNGKTIASGGEDIYGGGDINIRLWDVKTGVSGI